MKESRSAPEAIRNAAVIMGVLVAEEEKGEELTELERKLVSAASVFLSDEYVRVSLDNTRLEAIVKELSEQVLLLQRLISTG